MRRLGQKDWSRQGERFEKTVEGLEKTSEKMRGDKQKGGQMTVSTLEKAGEKIKETSRQIGKDKWED